MTENEPLNESNLNRIASTFDGQHRKFVTLETDSYLIRKMIFQFLLCFTHRCFVTSSNIIGWNVKAGGSASMLIFNHFSVKLKQPCFLNSSSPISNNSFS